MTTALGALLAVTCIAVVWACAPVAELSGTSATPMPRTSVQASDARGTIEFGTGGTECSLTSRATSFPTSETFRLVAYLARPLHAGEANRMVIFGPEGEDEVNAPPPPPFAHCIFNDVYPGLSPGHYVIEMRAGTEVLAKGVFDITP